MNKRKSVYISRNYKGVSAGNDARTDTEALLDKFGYRNIGLKQSFSQSKVTDFIRNLVGTIKGLILIPTNGILFIQYPTKKYYVLLCRVAHLKNTRVISLIHDLGSFRRKRISIEQEIGRLNHSDFIIATNQKMADWLTAHNIKAEINSLGVWHFLSKEERKPEFRLDNNNPYSICYAGALNRRKNAFLYEFISSPRNFVLNIYGDRFDIADTNDFHCRGYIDSDTFILTNNDDFGLVWDGDSMDECSGSFGAYLEYNTPHKISFYIKSHLPVIIWKHAALAPMIEENRIGITIDSLTEINSILSFITPGYYNEMKRNVIEMSKKLQSGFYLKEAIDKFNI